LQTSVDAEELLDDAFPQEEGRCTPRHGVIVGRRPYRMILVLPPQAMVSRLDKRLRRSRIIQINGYVREVRKRSKLRNGASPKLLPKS
jgi:hypothetical protein